MPPQNKKFITFICEGDFPGGSVAKNPPANAGNEGLTPGSGRSSGEGNGNSLQYSCHGQRSLADCSPPGSERAGHD